MSSLSPNGTPRTIPSFEVSATNGGSSDLNVLLPDKTPLTATTMAGCFSGDSDERFDQVLATLVEQQASLQSIAQMQAKLESMVQKQHKFLEQRLETFAPFVNRPACNLGDLDAEPSENSEVRSNGSLCAPSAFKSWRVIGSKVVHPSHSIDMKPKAMFKMLKSVVSHPLWDTAMGTCVLLNLAVMLAEIQWQGFSLGWAIGARQDDAGWHLAQSWFDLADKAFNAVYLVEVCLQALVLGVVPCRRDLLHCIDTLAILISVAHSFIFDFVFHLDSTAKSLFRLVKLVRIIRIIRLFSVLRKHGVMTSLQVFVKVILKSAGSLFWSMVVLFFIIISAGLLIFRLTQGFIADDTKDLVHRQWVYHNYGSAARASYTMFEATFSGVWATHHSRPLIDNVSPWFRIFWIGYTVMINFAVTRVVGALFLKQTLEVAAIDADRKALARQAEKEKITETLRQIFKLGDQMGDGVLAKWEFEQMMEKEEVLDMFDSLEMDPPEVYMLYNILCEDDGVADQEEFLNGALKLKMTVKAVDVIQLLHEQMVLKRSISSIEEALHKMDKALHPLNPWKPKPHFHHLKRGVARPSSGSEVVPKNLLDDRSNQSEDDEISRVPTGR